MSINDDLDLGTSSRARADGAVARIDAAVDVIQDAMAALLLGVDQLKSQMRDQDR